MVAIAVGRVSLAALSLVCWVLALWVCGALVAVR